LRWICYWWRIVRASEELVKHRLPTIGHVTDVEVLLGTCMLTVAQASVVVHQLGGEATAGKAGGDAACCMVAAGCSEQQGCSGVGHQWIVVGVDVEELVAQFRQLIDDVVGGAVDERGGGGHRIDLGSGYQCQSPTGRGALGGG